MSGCDYIADFGDFIKVGETGNPTERINTLSNLFKCRPKSYFFRRFNDNLMIEGLIKTTLKEFLFPVFGVKTETFKYPYKNAINALAEAEDFNMGMEIARYVSAIEHAKFNGTEFDGMLYGGFVELFALSDVERLEIDKMEAIPVDAYASQRAEDEKRDARSPKCHLKIMEFHMGEDDSWWECGSCGHVKTLDDVAVMELAIVKIMAK